MESFATLHCWISGVIWCEVPSPAGDTRGTFLGCFLLENPKAFLFLN